VLVETAVNTEGGILELGCGDYSTPILAAIAKSQGRAFVSQASDAEWAKKYGALVQMIDWATWKPEGRWGMVFLDSEEDTGKRISRIPALASVTDVVVMHDAQASTYRNNWDECTADFDVTMHKNHFPWTAVLRKKNVAQ
jgi:hypothetical protein